MARQHGLAVEVLRKSISFRINGPMAASFVGMKTTLRVYYYYWLPGRVIATGTRVSELQCPLVLTSELARVIAAILEGD